MERKILKQIDLTECSAIELSPPPEPIRLDIDESTLFSELPIVKDDSLGQVYLIYYTKELIETDTTRFIRRRNKLIEMILQAHMLNVAVENFGIIEGGGIIMFDPREQYEKFVNSTKPWEPVATVNKHHIDLTDK